MPLWSPDGKSLAYLFLTSQESDPLCQYFLKIHSPSTGKTKALLLSFKPDQYSFANGWTSDGRSLLLRGESKGHRGLWRVDAGSGECRLVHEATSISAWTEDGRAVFETQWTAGDPNRREFKLVRTDPATGTARDIFKGRAGEIISWISVSPDGKMIGLMTYDRVRSDHPSAYIVIPEAGGSEIARIPNEFSLFYWAPKSLGGVVALKRFTEEEPAELWFYPQGSEEAGRRLDFGADQTWRDIVFSPDGKTMAYAPATGFASTFWSVENYLPKKK
jgi:dipeptidyl aminopeptidase/acylaminoacyl peptidase